jgi:hypothetical protein
MICSLAEEAMHNMMYVIPCCTPDETDVGKRVRATSTCVQVTDVVPLGPSGPPRAFRITPDLCKTRASKGRCRSEHSFSTEVA